MASIFSKIISGEIPAYIVAEDEHHIAFLDVSPVVRGHVLCIPKKEVDYIFDMDDHDIQALMLFCKKVAKALKLVVPCKKIGVSVVGLEVPHAHVHLIPMNAVSDMAFTNTRLTLSANEYKELQETIASKVAI
jgi:histidine triad (HIT) family protein